MLVNLPAIICFVLFPGTLKLIAQDQKPVLERAITIQFSNERTDVVLNEISQKGQFSFSYNPAILDPAKPVSGSFENKPVREILNTIFQGRIDYREKRGYLILQKSKLTETKPEARESFIFSGYVRNEAGMSLPWVSIYDRASLESTISNEYGYYRIKFSDKDLPLSLNYSKQGYLDTTINVNPATPAFINISLKEVKPVVPPAIDYDSLSRAAEGTVSTFFIRYDEKPNSLNITDTMYRKYQVSLLPYVGTNLKLSDRVINDYSLNVFGGVSMGTRKAEMAGFFNINRSDMSGVQLAGFINLNGGDVKGVQLAGFTNLVRKNVDGVQAAGFVNVDWENTEGVLLAGFVNMTKGKSKGAQVAGFLNTALDTVSGIQLSGYVNIARRSLKGAQVSGSVNVVLDTLNGIQVGVINYGKHIKGVQLGILNISKSTTGVPVGLLSYVHDGYHKVEISADEIYPLNLAFRTGVTSFHNIISAGMNPFYGDTSLWNIGYGVGTSAPLSRKTLLDFDMTGAQIISGNDFDKINFIYKAYLGVETRISKTLGLAFGATVNARVFKSNYHEYPDIFSWYEPHIFYDHTWEPEHTRMIMWWGGKVALRLF